MDIGPREEPPHELDALANECLGIARGVRRALGVGMFERVYQEALSIALTDAGIPYRREVQARATLMGRDLGIAFRVDFLVKDRLVLELKSTMQAHSVHEMQLMTYLRAGRWPLGYVMNFGTTPFCYRRKICSEFL